MLSPFAQDGIMRARRRTFVLHPKGDEPARESILLSPAQDFAADEIRFRQVDEKSEPGFDRIVFRR